jgi:hypothetical protein
VSDALLAEFFALLLERRGARRDARAVEEALDVLQAFHRRDVLRLRAALHAAGEAPRFVPQAERDALFIAARQRESDA